jgi:excisionase family DNA binding protein
VHRWPPEHTANQSPAQPTTTPPAPAVAGAQGHIRDPLARLPEMLTVKEVAAILRIGRNQLYGAVARGDLRAVRIGRTIRIPKAALLDVLTTPPGKPGATGSPK